MNIDIYESELGAELKPKKKIRYTTGFVYKYKENNLFGETDAIARVYMHKNNIKFILKTGSSIMLDLSFFITDLQGSSNQGVEYELLEGQGVGKNLRSSLVLTQRIFKQIELTFYYDARISEAIFPVHSFRAQFRAFF